MRRIIKISALFMMSLALIGLAAPQTKTSAQTLAGGSTIQWYVTCFEAGIVGRAPQGATLGVQIYNLDARRPFAFAPSDIMDGPTHISPIFRTNYVHANLINNGVWEWGTTIVYPSARGTTTKLAGREVYIWNTSGGFAQYYFVQCDSSGNVVNTWTSVVQQS